MGVHQSQATLFELQVLQSGDQGDVLEHIGVVACVEGMTVTEHGLMVTA